MGLLSLGTPLGWHDSKKYNEHVRENGVLQLINIFSQHKDISHRYPFFWGDETEYMLVQIDDETNTAKLAIDKDYILELAEDPSVSLQFEEKNVSLHPEYGRYMIEATPSTPFDGDELTHYTYIEENMNLRRELCEALVSSDIKLLALTTFPRMGCGDFTSPSAKPIGPASRSLFLPDEIINRHVRFPTLTANIRKRRGCKVAINIPIYPDIKTKLNDDSIPDRNLFSSDREPWLGASKPGHVYLDSMGFGMGSSCLQTTMQAGDIDEARYLYDSLAPLTPLMLSLSAAAPFFKGFIVNQDVRWNVISGAVDDRTFCERDVDPYPGYDYFGGLDISDRTKVSFDKFGGCCGCDGDVRLNEYGETLCTTIHGNKVQKIPKSRYDSIDSYLGDQGYKKGQSYYFKDDYNDIYSPTNKKVYDQLIGSGLFDHQLAQHFAHLFIRDPLVVFSERIDQNNELDNDHFENIQSTNWQTLRFKPPALYPKNLTSEEFISKPGWRIEFRPIEIQLTDFENAAYASFITLLSKAILYFHPDFYIPILKVDDNMRTAHEVDSVFKSKFWFKSPSLSGIIKADFLGYDVSWFDRYLNEGNDELEKIMPFLNGNAKTSLKEANSNPESEKEPFACFNESKMTLNEIMNGNDEFPGLISMAVKYVAVELVPKCSRDSATLRKTLTRLQKYLQLLSFRAAGKIPTTAHWLRDLATTNPLYKHDSKISEPLSYFIVDVCSKMCHLELHDKKLINSLFGETITDYLYGS